MRKTLLAVAVACSLVAAGGVAYATGGNSTTPGFAQKPLAGEKPVDLGGVPEWVLHTARVALPNAKIAGAQIDEDEIAAVYEIQGTYKGAGAEIDVFPDGTLDEIELIIKESEVPAAARELFAKYFPNFDLVKVEKSIRPNRTGLLETWYEWDGTTEDGVAVDVEVDSRGSTYLVEPD
jgi:hypothetical protein